MPRPDRSLLPALVLSLLPVAALGQATPPDVEPFGETLEVRVVNVEVHVTDKQGEPVTDLTAADFEVREDGQPVPITNFYRVIADAPAGDERSTEPSPLSVDGLPATAEAIGWAPRPEDRKLRLVVFIDNFFTRPAERNRNMPALRQFLQTTLGPEDEAMVVTYDRGLHVLQPFTTDHARIYELLFEVETEATFQNELDSARREVLQRIDEANSSDEAMIAVRPYAEVMRNDIEHAIDAVLTVVNDLAGLTGRKMLLHVSSGVPMIAGGDMFYAVEEKFQQGGSVNLSMSYDMSRRFTQLASQANAHGVVFYTVDVGGLRAGGGMSAAERGLDTPMLGVRVESDRVANRQSPLRLLAQETGGRAVVNQNNIQPALDEIRATLDTYYSLGFVSAHQGDNQYHDLRVKVARKGVTVEHRRGYRDKSVDVEMEEGVRAALIHRAQTNPWGVTIRAGAPQARDNGLFLVPVQIIVPLRALEIVPSGEYLRADLTFFFAAMDAEARLSAVTSVPVGVRLPAAQAAAAEGESYILNHQLLMRGGTNTLGAGIYDRFGAESVFLTFTLTVP
jgi:VWFA-related protein